MHVGFTCRIRAGDSVRVKICVWIKLSFENCHKHRLE